MRMRAVIGTGLAVACLWTVAACGGDSDKSSAPARPPKVVAPLGPFVGECGHVTDDEVRTVGGLGQVAQAFKNSVGCHWSSGGYAAPSVTFASYRGSPIDREKAWVSSVGRAPETIDVAGKQGFKAADPSGAVCDLAVGLGDDFFEWSISFGLETPPGASPCDPAGRLAQLTVQRLG